MDGGVPPLAVVPAALGACYTAADNSGDEARANREILVTVLTAAGLVNYPAEWWHWSYSDRYWRWPPRPLPPRTAPLSCDLRANPPLWLFFGGS